MCDFNAVRNWFIAAMVALGGAISSVAFATYYPYFALGALWMALAWIGTAIFAFGLAMSALRAFCSCATNSACRTPCLALNFTGYVVIATLWAASALIVVAIAEGGVNLTLAIAFVVAFGAVGTASGYWTGFLSTLGTCRG